MVKDTTGTTSRVDSIYEHLQCRCSCYMIFRVKVVLEIVIFADLMVHHLDHLSHLMLIVFFYLC